MYDFRKWREWLKQQESALAGEGFETSFRAGPDDSPKPGVCLDVIGTRAFGSFENWATGETDYSIFARTPPELCMISHKWGVIVSDSTFNSVYSEFLFKLHEANRP